MEGFGFTEEVFQALEQMGMSQEKENVKRLYEQGGIGDFQLF